MYAVNILRFALLTLAAIIALAVLQASCGAGIQL